MREEENLKFKLFKHIIYSTVVFIMILSIFGSVVFLMLRNLIYSNINNELLEAQNLIVGLKGTKFDFFPSFKIFNKNQIKDFDVIFEESSIDIIKEKVNPDINVIIRNADGEIISAELGRLSFYIDQIDFDKKNIDKIYELEIGKKEYSYRGINFLFNNDENYIQLLINSDSEKRLLNNYKDVIISSVIIGSFLSIIASFFIAKKNLEPLKDSLVKQMEFVQNVSHELRTPLTIIQAKQELLLQDPESKIIDKTEDIAQTLNETKRLSKLVKDLLILSRADSEKDTIQKESVNIDEYIKEIVTPYIEIAELEEKIIKFNLNYGTDIEVDPNKFYQLLVILLDNAIKYTESKDEIEITTFLKDNKFIMEVKDTGIGITDEGLNRIFERFYREDSARSRETGGTGLGLSIANYIVSAHNGTIKAIHNNPKGTIFVIKLPR